MKEKQSILPVLFAAVEAELKQSVAYIDQPGVDEVYRMMTYHLGWEGEGAGPAATGKRLRPLFVLLSNSAAGGEWQRALPAAAAVELIHNFSLIHDDIQDNSDLRRGRLTVWKRWGIAQAINTGDAMFTLAYLTLLRLDETTTPLITLQAARLLQEACLELTYGQHMDLAYEARGDLTLEAYWPMVNGKTAALLSACTGLGALIAQAASPVQEAYRQFGRSLGLAFQAQDDLLGIWGDAALTGKSAESDLVSGKKSLPVLFGLDRKGRFASRWVQGAIRPDEVAELARLLDVEGARAFTEEKVRQLTDQALEHLADAGPQGEAGQALHDLALQLVNRKS